MTLNEIRNRYLAYFEARGHKIVPSARLVPENDPTTLFTGSGMQPMLPYFLGTPHPLGKRVADSQKSFRSQDIEEVGDNRHTTFFEMLGNWSFGDYFKKEQIPWMFEFLTKELGLNPQQLFITCYLGDPALGIPKDEESAALWQKLFKEKGIDAEIAESAEGKGMQGARIFYYDARKNWWSRAGMPDRMPIGEPGGPDTEMFWDFGEHLGLHEESIWKSQPCHVNCDCGRFMEIGNNVFMEYIKTEKGFEKLPKPNVDFGGGLERIGAALGNNPDMFLIREFQSMAEAIERQAQIKYGADPKSTRALRIILDHLRAAVFLIGDGVTPSNTDQGYVLRRLIRRAVRFGELLKIESAALAGAAQSVITSYKDLYTNLGEQQEYILKTLAEEEARFRDTLAKGLQLLEKIEEKHINGQDAFILFSTYGFPVELTLELAQERDKTVGLEDFYKAMEEHRELSRAGGEKKFKGGLAGTGEMETNYHTATHLLHKALRDVLGTHVFQKGSNITPERLRFDFSFERKMTDEEKKKVEDLVNEQIAKALEVSFQDLPLAEAEKLGAIGLFEEKYGDTVRVYKIGDYSLEFCGGPHVENTSKLGEGGKKFKIAKEEAVAAGVRRIKAVLE